MTTIERHPDFPRVFGPLFEGAEGMAVCDCGNRKFYVIVASDDRVIGMFCSECSDATKVPFVAVVK